jgi:RNA polymerase sigma-70 factor (ECF subfamily)
MRPTDPATSLESLLAERAWLQALARRLVRDESAADDLAQETWLAALRRAPARSTSARAWLAAVLRNALRDRRRAETSRARREFAVARPEANDEPDVVARADAHLRLAQAVHDLDEPYRTTVLLRYFDGLEIAEIAARLGTSEDAVRMRLRRAIAQLRGELGEDDRRAWAVLLLACRPARTAGATAAIGGALVMKKVLAVAAVLVLLGGGWFALRDSSPPRDTRTAHASVPASAGPRHNESAVAPPTSAAAAIASVPGGVIRGEVVDRDGAPIADAEVYVAAPNEDRIRRKTAASRATRTDTSGRFVLAASLDAVWDVIARKDGRRPACATDLRLTAAAPETVVRLVLESGERISGRVTDLDGRPVAAVLVRALGDDADPDRPDPDVLAGRRGLAQSWAVTRSSDDGRYSLDGLTTGATYSVEVRRSGMFPDFATSIGPRTVVAGATGVDFVVDAAREARLLILDSRTKSQVPGVRFDYVAHGVELLGDAQTREWYERGPDSRELSRQGIAVLQGRVRRDNPDAARPRVRLTLSAPGYAPESLDVELGGPAPAASVQTVELRPTASGFGDVALHFRRSDGSAPRDATLPLLLRDAEDRRIEYFGRDVRGGALTLEHLPAGRFHVEYVHGPGMGPTISDFDGTFDAFDVNVADGATQTVTVDVHPQLALMALEVDVVDDLGAPLPFAPVTILGPTYAGGSPSIDVDAPLAHHVLLVPPGTVTVSASKSGYASASQRVEGRGGDRIAVRLALRKERR